MDKVNCDKCKNDFLIKLKEKKHAQGIVETYFKCPHCSEKYIAFVTDAKTRKGQREMKALQLALGKEKNPAKRQEIFNDIQKKRGSLKIHMDRLKEQIASV